MKQLRITMRRLIMLESTINRVKIVGMTIQRFMRLGRTRRVVRFLWITKIVLMGRLGMTMRIMRKLGVTRRVRWLEQIKSRRISRLWMIMR